MTDYAKILNTSLLAVILYNGLLLFFAFSYFNKFKLKIETLLVFLIFYKGLFAFIAYSIPLTLSIYKLGLFLCLFLLVSKYKKLIYFRGSETILLLIFTLNFLTIAIDDMSIGVASKLMNKHLVFFITFILIRNNPNLYNKFKKPVYYLVSLQIALSVVKLLLYGPIEAVVGSISAKGAGEAVSFPIVAMFYLSSFQNSSKFESDNFFGTYLKPLIIGIASIKRSVVFLFPGAVVLWIYNFQGRKKWLLSKVPIIFAVFIISLVFNPTLNRDKTFFGDFDWSYLREYVIEYNFGADRLSRSNLENWSSGRGGALKRLIQGGFELGKPLGPTFFDDIDESDWAYENLDHLGLLGFPLKTILLLGTIGFISLVSLNCLVLYNSYPKRAFIVIAPFFLYDVLFYEGLILSPVNSIVLSVLSFKLYNKHA